MRQTIHVFHRKINCKITQLRDMENTHNKNMRSCYNSIVVVLLMISVAQQPRPTMIRNTKSKIISTTLCSAEELVHFNFEVEYKQ